MAGFSEKMEKTIMPVANKFARQRHLVAIRDAFMSLLPINLVGGLCAIVKAPPVTEETTNALLLGWKAFADNNSLVFEWLYAFTLGAMSLYIAVGITHFLCKHYNINSLIPVLFTLVGFMIIVTQPVEISWAAKSLSFRYIDGKGLIPAIFIAILTTELYRLMKQKNFGKIAMPASVPPSLSDVFATLIPGVLILVMYIAIFAIFNAFGTSLPEFLYTKLTPAFQAADSLPSVIIITIVTHFLWFFGIHDAALSGIVGPIRDGGLANNADAVMFGQALPNIYTTPFWVYFVIIGGCGAVLGLAIVLLFTKSKQLKTVGRVGILPAFFNISEPIIFGIPLMLNPIFFVPFLLTSTVNGVITYILMSVGFMEKTFAMVSWNMPSVFGAFFSTLDWKAPVLIIILTVINGLMYLPFVRIYDRQQTNLENALEEEEKKTEAAKANAK